MALTSRAFFSGGFRGYSSRFILGLVAYGGRPFLFCSRLGSLRDATLSAINSRGVAVGFITDNQRNITPVSLNGQTNWLRAIGEASQQSQQAL